MIGSRFLHYEVLAELGRGGMGEVYRARDTKLDREVALKVLSPAFAKDPERLARLRREAKVLASISHPSIAAVHGLEESDGTVAVAMELAEGEDLSDRIRRGPIPWAEAVEIARNIAEGVESAHAQGVIHRDLKPSNIKVTRDGSVKILDFGLARAFTGEPESTDLTMSPTITAAHTQAGTILGTAAYMSPEQARGLPVDKRSDVWSFGVVLMEMLTGKQPFDGDTVSDMLASILKSEPDFNDLPGDTPARLRELLERCLAKRRRDRRQDIGDVRLDLESVAVVDEMAADARGRSPLTIIVAALVAAVIAAGVTWWLRPATPSTEPEVFRYSIQFPDHITFTNHTVAPNGTMLFWGRRNAEPKSRVRLYLRRPDQFDFVEVEGSAGVVDAAFSPDSNWIAMLAPDQTGTDAVQLWKVPVDQASPRLELVSWRDEWMPSVNWLRGGDILASTRDRTFVRIPTDGSSRPAPVKIMASGFDDSVEIPRFSNAGLPDGRHILVTVDDWGEEGYATLIVLANVETGETQVLVRDGARPQWLETGHIVFSRGPSVLALPFDLASLQATGPPVAVASGIRIRESWAHGYFHVTEDGTLVHLPGGLTGQQRQLVWATNDLDDFTPWSQELRPYNGTVRISPNGKLMSVVIASPRGIFETWISSVDRPRLRRFVFAQGQDCVGQAFTHDGAYLVSREVAGGSDVQLRLVPTDGTGAARILYKEADPGVLVGVTDLAADGTLLLSRRGLDGTVAILGLDTEEKDAETRTILEGATLSRLSWDQRWLAYLSDSSGRNELYIRRWLGKGQLGPEHRVSTTGSSTAFWRPTDPPQLVFNHQSKAYRVVISGEDDPSISSPELMLESYGEVYDMAYHPDGRILALLRGSDEADPTRVVVTQNWTTEMKRILGQP